MDLETNKKLLWKFLLQQATHVHLSLDAEPRTKVIASQPQAPQIATSEPQNHNLGQKT